MAKPILITAAGGRVGGVSTYLVEMLRKDGLPVRALVRTDDERAEPLRKLGAEVVVGDLTKLEDVHRAIKGCSKVYYSMPVIDSYLEASITVAAVAKHYGVELLVNMSQLTTATMDINNSSPSPQSRAHWLAEQALEWSGTPFVHIKPTAFMEIPYFRAWARAILSKGDNLTLPLGNTKVNPIAAYDVARVIAEVIKNPAPHLGKSLLLVGNEMQSMDEIANEYSKALGRTIKYVPMDLDAFDQHVIAPGVKQGAYTEHVQVHLRQVAVLLQTDFANEQNQDVEKITGKPPMSLSEWISRDIASWKK